MLLAASRVVKRCCRTQSNNGRYTLTFSSVPCWKAEKYLFCCMAFFVAATFLTVDRLGGSSQGSRVLPVFSQPFNTSLVTSQQNHVSSKESSSNCSRDWSGHLRIKSPPVEFPWLAVNEREKDVNLLGPGGGEVKLNRLGTLTLLNNTAYHFQPQLAGQYQLLVSGRLVSHFYSHPANCNCPSEFPKFLAEYECPEDMVAQVQESMVRWPHGSITEDMFFKYNGAPAVLSNPHVVQLAIFDNKLYCKPQNGQFCPFDLASGASANYLPKLARHINAVLRRVALRDVVFYYNHVDGPIMDHNSLQPMFVGSSTEVHGGKHTNSSLFHLWKPGVLSLGSLDVKLLLECQKCSAAFEREFSSFLQQSEA